MFGSSLSNSERSSVIIAYWPVVAGNISHNDILPITVGKIQFFLEHSITLEETSGQKKENHYFAYVDWFTQYDNWDFYGSNCIVSYPTLHTPSLFSFLPLPRIHSKCA